MSLIHVPSEHCYLFGYNLFTDTPGYLDPQFVPQKGAYPIMKCFLNHFLGAFGGSRYVQVYVYTLSYNIIC